MRPPAELIAKAIEARLKAYAPYSGYFVGAALESDTGEIATGCNIENLSYGATICAERTAITKMISEGIGNKIRQIAVATKDGGLPCGICLQVLREFAAEPSQVVVHAANLEGEFKTFRFDQLMPYSFSSKEVGRTDLAE